MKVARLDGSFLVITLTTGLISFMIRDLFRPSPTGWDLGGGTSGVGCCFEIQLARKGLPVELMARSVFLLKLD